MLLRTPKGQALSKFENGPKKKKQAFLKLAKGLAWLPSGEGNLLLEDPKGQPLRKFENGPKKNTSISQTS